MQTFTAEWNRVGSALYKANAQRVAEEIISIGPEAKPQQIVDKARNKETELHKCFTWDNKAAADKWRLHEARNVVGCLVIHRDEQHENKPEIRYFHKNDSGGYKPASFVFTHADEHEKLLQAAYSDLQAFKRKYESLQELDWLIEQFP